MPAHIIIVEDVRELADVLRQLLEHNDCTTQIFETGEGVLALLDTGNAPDAILCDIILPGVSGLEILAQIRAHATWKQVFFVAMSGKRDDESLTMQRGADGFLVKPFSVHELLEVLRRSPHPLIATR